MNPYENVSCHIAIDEQIVIFINVDQHLITFETETQSNVINLYTQIKMNENEELKNGHLCQVKDWFMCIDNGNDDTCIMIEDQCNQPVLKVKTKFSSTSFQLTEENARKLSSSLQNLIEFNLTLPCAAIVRKHHNFPGLYPQFTCLERSYTNFI